MKPFKFHSPKTTTVAFQLAEKNSQYIAGGTNQVDLMKKHINEPNIVIDVKDALSNTIEIKKKGVHIGALATNSDVAENKSIQEDYSLISQAILSGASPQIRNMATTGGNLLQRTRCPYFYDTALPCNKRKPNSGCGALNGHQRMAGIVGTSKNCVAVHPSDFCVALVALDAEVNIIKQDGTEDTIAFEDFHRLPGNQPQKDTNLPEQALITSVFIPKNKFKNNVAYVKIRERDSYAFALVSAAAALELKNGQIKKARLASGGVAHKPWRWKTSERFLKGKQANRANFEEAARLAVAETQPLQNNTFKTALLEGAITEALIQCLSNSSTI